MCQLCNPEFKSIRVLIASKVVGWLPKHDDTDLESIVAAVIKEHAQSIEALDASISSEIIGCAEVKERLILGIRKSLPSISIEDRLYMALAAGALRFP